LSSNLFPALGSKSRVVSNASSQAPLVKVKEEPGVTTRKRTNLTEAGTTSKKPNLGAPIITIALSDDEM
ncbi:hypothetical protein A2U01_0063630, partial [Trifolium medium]|nr:hypothetical protein [Trifolium medium]